MDWDPPDRTHILESILMVPQVAGGPPVRWFIIQVFTGLYLELSTSLFESLFEFYLSFSVQGSASITAAAAWCVSYMGLCTCTYMHTRMGTHTLGIRVRVRGRGRVRARVRVRVRVRVSLSFWFFIKKQNHKKNFKIFKKTVPLYCAKNNWK